jgi:transposase
MAIGLRRKWSRGQVDARLANLSPCRIGMEACVGAHHLSRTLKALGHDARLMPAKYLRAYSKGQKNDYRDAEAIAEAVQRPTMKSVDGARIKQVGTRRRLAAVEQDVRTARRPVCLSAIKSGHIRDAIRRGPGGKELRPALFTVRNRGASLSKAKCVRVSL